MSILRSLLAISLVLLTAAAGWRGAHLPVDLENGTMKSVGTREAELAARRNREFGSDCTVLLLLEPRAATLRTDRSDPEVSTWLTGLRRHHCVLAADVVPQVRKGGGLVVAARLAPGVEAARSVAAFAAGSAPAVFRVSATGHVLGEAAIAESLAEEQARIVPLIVGALFAVLLLFFRHWALALAPLLPAAAGICWVGGLQAMLGLATDPVAALLAPVLLTVGVAGSIHLIEEFRAGCDAGMTAAAAARHARRSLLRPHVLTVVTTVAGFLGLFASSIPAVRRFGAMAAVGVAVTATLAFVLVPLWLRWCCGRLPPHRLRRWDVMAMWVTVAVRRHSRAIVGVAAATTLVCAWQWFGLRVDTDPIQVLPATHPFRTDTQRIAARLGGIDTFELLLPTPAPALAALRGLALMAEVTADPQVVGPAGPLRHGADGSDLVGFLIAPGSTTARERLFDRAEQRARALGWPDAAATGPAVQVARDSTALAKGQLGGMLFTAVALWLAMAIGLGSGVLGLIGMVPNLVPCVILYGGLALADRPLSVGTALIGSVMLGLIVDDTIHLLHGFHRSRLQGRGALSTMARMLGRIGRAVTLTSLVLATGFAAGSFGALATTREFGVLAAGTILTALAADVLLLPSLLWLCNRWTGP